jgi:hypothetical protein
MLDLDGLFVRKPERHFIARAFERKTEAVEAADDIRNGSGCENGDFFHKIKL